MAALRAAHEVEYENEDKYLEAMFTTVVDLLYERDSWGVGIKYTESGGITPYGPYYNKATAKKNGQRFANILGSDVFLQQLNAPSKLNDPTEESK